MIFDAFLMILFILSSGKLGECEPDPINWAQQQYETQEVA